MSIPTFDPAIERKIVADVSAEEPQKLLQQFSTLYRDAGSEDDFKAARFIKETLERHGVDVTIYTFPSYLSFPEKAALTVLRPERRKLPCITCAFAASTPARGIKGELVDLTPFADASKQHILDKKPDNFFAVDVKGKIVLLDGIQTPQRIEAAVRAGVKALIFIHPGDVMHEMIVTTIWGTPTRRSVGTFQSIPLVAVNQLNGQYLKNLVRTGPVQVNLKAQVWKGWKEIPVVVANIPGVEDSFVLASGHLDSWHVGITDNATGDASLLELARIFQKNRQHLRRGVRVAWWSGHSTGRYSGSTWYADRFWEELDRSCVIHINIDSPGVRNATVVTAAASAEVREFIKKAIRESAGHELVTRYPAKSGDQSFWGVGMPTIAQRTTIPPDHPDWGPMGGSGMGKWWHSPEDTLDKADVDVLVKDTRMVGAAIYRLCSLPVLPMDFVPLADDFIRVLKEIRDEAGGRLDLDQTIQSAETLRQEARRAQESLQQFNAGYGKNREERERRINAKLMRVSRILNPPFYTACGRYDQDPAVPVPHLAVLRPSRELARMDPASDAYGFLETELIRERNKVSDALRYAAELLSEVQALAKGE